MTLKKNNLDALKNNIQKQKEISNEMMKSIETMDKVKTPEEKDLMASQIAHLKNNFVEINERTRELIYDVNSEVYSSGMIFKETDMPLERVIRKDEFRLDKLEKLTLKKLGERKKEEKAKKIKKASTYVNLANRVFGGLSNKYYEEIFFRQLKRDLIKANMDFTARSYIPVIFFSTLLSFLAGLGIFLFFLFFNIGAELPIITLMKEDILLRFFKTVWLIFAVPITTFSFLYFYPAMEKKTLETRIENELPFAAIHMAAISGSMVDPSKIFEIIILTREYPYLEGEFRKIINGLNLHGYDLVGALRNAAFNGPSKKLSDLLNGLATTINSGGNLPDFFEKRAQSLLFEHRLEREKKARAAETFMDIYISVVIAAPMILMLLLMMMKISGLGISLSTGMITFLVIFGVTIINIFFMVFLQLRND